MAKAAASLLFKHQNGQWAKKLRGKLFYFGTDYDKAVDRYLADKDHLVAGRERQRPSDGATLAELVNLYVDGCRRRVSAGDLTQRSVDEAAKTLKRLASIRGKDDTPAHWSPREFEAIKEALFEPVKRTTEIRGGLKGKSVERRSAITVDGDIRRIKAFLNWCFASEYTPAPRYGHSFKQSSIKQRRLKRAAAGRRDLEPDAIRSILDACTVHLRPIVLLGINGGFGSKDIAELTLDDYDGGEWLEYARRKTGVERKVWLWPETREAIAAYLKIRKRPRKPEDERVLFVTKLRNPWHDDQHDAISKSFKQARVKAKVDRGSFYDLRRTYATVAEESLDFVAVSYTMGHAAGSADMAAKYRQRISDERLQRVAEHVRGWLHG